MIEVEQGLILFFKFSAFKIQSPSSGSCGDHLTITDGDGTPLMEKICGKSLPAAIASISNMIRIYFSTDGSGTRIGWNVSWTAVTKGECQQFSIMFGYSTIFNYFLGCEHLNIP